MFLTLESAWKLPAIAFYGLLTVNTVAWAQITPLPGGLSSIQNQSSLSSSTSSPIDSKKSPGTGSSLVRPLLIRRPDPELPPVPPAIVAASNVAQTVFAPRSSNKDSENPAPNPAQASGSDPFMIELATELASSAPSGSSSTTASSSVAAPVGESFAAPSISKNSALNPAQAKSFVVQASAVSDTPPSPPKPPASVSPKLPKADPLPAPLPAPKSSSPKAIVPNSVPSDNSEDEFLLLKQPPATNPASSNKSVGRAAEVVTEVAGQVAGDKAGDKATYMHLDDQPQPQQSTRAASGTTSSKPNAVTLSPTAKALKPEQIAALGNRQLESIEFNDVPLADAMKLFSEQSGLNVITSAEAGKARVTVFLKQVTAHDALEAIVKANGLFYRIEAASGIVRIATSKEYEKDLSSFREEQTRVFTLLYPNPIAVAQVIQQVFGNRVQMNRADADMDDLLDLSRRFNRFDMVDGRSLGLGGANNSGSGRSSGNSATLGGRNGLGGGGNRGQNGNGMGGGLGGALGGMGGGLGGLGSMQNNSARQLFNSASPQEKASLSDLSAEEIQQLENELAQQGELAPETQSDLLQRRDATIYISTIRRNNQIIVRTGDNRSMEQIAQLINQLDVPTPTVLLEVKVLRIVLADGFNSAFEYFGAAGNASAAMSDGSLQPAFPGASSAARALGAGLGVAGGVPGSLSFQMVDDKFRVRMQLLESKNCVTALATPLILTANNEVSRIFVGDTLPFTVGFTPSQVLSSVTAVNGAVAATPVTELRDVGQSLLITPNINADRTVTLRVIEENSERVVSGSSIPVPATSGSGVTNVNVDTVRRRTISGTIVAQDGMAVALGGLIEEQVHDARDQVPVLGNIPGLGLLFRRQSSGKSRSELVVIVRPYVFNTPTESAATTEMLLGELSTHPNSPEATGTMNALPCPVTRSESESSQRAKLFQLHTRSISP